jgi:hypothetical protein
VRYTSLVRPILLFLVASPLLAQDDTTILEQCRIVSKEHLIAAGGGGEATETAVLNALKWLARHQAADGSWKTKDYVDRCKATGEGTPCKPNPGGTDDWTVGNTGLALMAFLGTGLSTASDKEYDGINFGKVIRDGIEWLRKQQDKDGCVGARGAKYMYGHAIATIALAEAHALHDDKTLLLPAQKAVDFIVAAQNKGDGWRYSAQCGDSDPSVTGWCVMALRAAEIAMLSFRKDVYDGALACLAAHADEDAGRAGYFKKGTAPNIVPAPNEHFDVHPTLTAMVMHSRIQIQKRKNIPFLAKGSEVLLKDPPKWDGNAIDFYHWFQASQALFQFHGSDDANWWTWNGVMKEVLTKNQTPPKAGCKGGSWEPVDRWSHEGGRVYSTAINALTLETYYRYVMIFRGK